MVVEIKFFEKYTGKPIGMYERFLSVEADGSVMEVTEGFSGVTLSNPSDVVYEIINDAHTQNATRSTSVLRYINHINQEVK